MPEIYNITIQDHEQFARAQQAQESFRKQFHVSPSGAGQVAAQVQILTTSPQQSAIEALWQIKSQIRWAKVVVPEDYYAQRSFSPFILGPSEKQDRDIQRLEAYMSSIEKSPGLTEEMKREAEEEAKKISTCLDLGIKSTNNLISYALSRRDQFLQG